MQDVASTSMATFDAVVVCNGHYSQPRRPELQGAESFPGRIMHSHSYRENEPFRGLTVIVLGASASGEDICREIALVADKVRKLPAWLSAAMPGGTSVAVRPVRNSNYLFGTI
jgi:cation diffusion facilitator CzcD-associated flavoprotein CzcO